MKKHYYPPKYKICFKTKSNVWGDLKIKNFKKKKWQIIKKEIFFKDLKNKIKSNKKIYFRKFFKEKIINKQHLRAIYGNLKDYQVRNIFHKTSTRGHSVMLKRNFISFFEFQFAYFLTKIFFTDSIQTARQEIHNGTFLVNNHPIYNHRYHLGPFSLISLSKEKWIEKQSNIKHHIVTSFRRRLSLYNKNADEKKIFKKNLLFPEYLEINYNTLEIYILRKPYINEVYFSGKMNLEFARTFYF